MYDYVRFDISEHNPSVHVVIEIDLPGKQIRNAYGTWVQVTDLGTAVDFASNRGGLALGGLDRCGVEFLVGEW